MTGLSVSFFFLLVIFFLFLFLESTKTFFSFCFFYRFSFFFLAEFKLVRVKIIKNEQIIFLHLTPQTQKTNFEMPRLAKQPIDKNQRSFKFPDVVFDVSGKFEPLPRRVKKNGFKYVEVVRKEDVAMYKQTMQVGNQIVTVAYEVFRVKRQKATDAKFGDTVVHLKAKELFPSNESFGKYAWSCTSRERADVLFAQLLSGLHENEIDNC